MTILGVLVEANRLGTIDWGSAVRRRPIGETLAAAAERGTSLRIARDEVTGISIESGNWDESEVSARRIVPHGAI